MFNMATLLLDLAADNNRVSETESLDELETASTADSTASTMDTGLGSSVVTDFEDDHVTADDMLRSPELDRLRLPDSVTVDEHSLLCPGNHALEEKSEDGGVFNDTMRQTSHDTDANVRSSRSFSDPGHTVDDDNGIEAGTFCGSSDTYDYSVRKESDLVSNELDRELNHRNDHDVLRTESVSTQEVRLLVERSFQIDAVACKGVPLVHCVRLMCSFLLSGNPGEMLSDSSVRVSVKSLALSCIAQAVRLHPEAFLVQILPEVKEESGVEDLHQSSPQLVRDVLLFSTHGDPQLRGSLSSVIGNVIEAGLQKGR